MIETMGTILLWLAAIVLVAGGVLTVMVNGEYSRVSGQTVSARPGYIAAAIGLALTALLLAGCSTPTVTEERVVTVKEPVPVHPVNPVDVPAPVQGLPSPPPADARPALDLAMAKVCELVAYMVKADPLLRLSSGQQPRAIPPFNGCEAEPLRRTGPPPR